MISMLRRIVGAVLLTIVAFAAAGFATGRIASVVTSGTSMLPDHRAGDLVIVADTGSYEVGQVAAYRDEATAQVVLHRIVGGDAEAFQFRGDNNTSIDPTHPSSDDLIGREMLHVPTIGRFVGSPLALSVVGALAAALLALMVLVPGDRGATPGRAGVGAAGRGPVRWWNTASIVVVVGLAGGLAASLLLPPDIVVPPPGEMQHGVIGYSATVAPSDTYPDGSIDTGDTVFLQLLAQIDVVFRYETEADVSGNGRLRAVVSTANGWSSTMALSALTPVSAGGLEMRGALDLTAIRDLVTRVETATGVVAGSVDVRVEAVVSPERGALAAAPFSMSLPFRLDALSLDLLDEAKVEPSALGPAVVDSSPLDTAGDIAELEPSEVGGIPRQARRILLVALLVAVVATVLSWPGNGPDRRADDHLGTPRLLGGVGPSATLARAIELPADMVRVQLAAVDDVQAIARSNGVPVFARDDGWSGVVTGDAVYWWAPVDSRVATTDQDRERDVPTLEIPITDLVAHLSDEHTGPRRPLFAPQRSRLPGRATPATPQFGQVVAHLAEIVASKDNMTS